MLPTLGAELVVKQDALNKDDIIKIYKVPVAKEPAFKATINCSAPMVVSLVWESSNDGGASWRELSKTGIRQPIDSATLVYKVGAQVQNGVRTHLLVEYSLFGVANGLKLGVGGALNAELNAAGYQTVTDPGSIDRLVHIEQGSVQYRLRLQGSK